MELLTNLDEDQVLTFTELQEATEALVGQLLQVLVPPEILDENQHMVDTPRRVTDWLMQYSQPTAPLETIIGPIFDESYHGMVFQNDIAFSALCAHHLLPFTGHAAVGYVPAGKVIGISKLTRIVRFFAQRATLQELITQQILEALVTVTEPTFAGVMLYDVSHMCMSIRGVQEPHAKTTTMDFHGRDTYIDHFLKLAGK